MKMVNEIEDCEKNQSINLPVARISPLEHKYSICREKIILIILSSILLACSSLSICTFIVNTVVTTPEFTHVESVVKDAIVEMQHQRDSYEYCIKKSIDRCNKTLDEEYHTELEESTHKSIINNEIIQNSTISQQVLTSLEDELRSNVNEYLIENPHQSIYSEKCSSSEILMLNEFYSISTKENEILNIAQLHANQSESSFSQLMTYYQDRIQYDMYYLQSKLLFLNSSYFSILSSLSFQLPNITFHITRMNLTSLSACITMNKECSVVNSVYSQYMQIKQQYNQTKELIIQKQGLLKYRVFQYQHSIQGLIEEIQQLYSRIHEVQSLLDRYGIDLGILPTLSLPTLVLPSFLIDYDLPEPEEIYAKLGEFFIEMDSALSTVINQTQLQANELIETAEEFTEMIIDYFDDYDPPEFNTTQLFDEFLDHQEEFLAITWQALVNQTTTITSSINNTVTTFIPIIRDSVYSFFSTWKPKSFVGLDISVSSMLSKFEWITRWTVCLDILYRVLSLLKQIITIVLRGELTSLTISIKNQSTSSSSFYLRILSYILPFLLPVITTLFFILIGLVFIILLYTPLYQSYINGCVNTSIGTSLTKNLHSLAYNYITMQGDSAAVIGEERYHQKKDDYCQNMYSSSLEQYQQQLEQYQAILQAIQTSREIIELSEKCLKPQVISNTTLFTLYSNYSQSIIFHNLLESTFNCSSLNQCRIQCNQPSELLLQDQSYRVGCTTEWFIHSNIVTYGLAIVLWILLNITRYLILSAYKKLRLSSFSYQNVNLILPATTKGEILLNPSKVSSKVITTAIKKKKNQNHICGILFILIALIIQFVWVFILILVAPSISHIYKQ